MRAGEPSSIFVATSLRDISYAFVRTARRAVATPRYTMQLFSLVLTLAGIFTLVGCHKPSTSTATQAPSPAISITNRQDRVELVMTVTPGAVDMTRDQILEIAASYPSEMDVTIPAMEDRCEGFISNQTIDDPPTSVGGTTRIRRRYLLTPSLASEYRIAPAAITFTDKGHTPPRSGWFPSPPVTLPSPTVHALAGETPTWAMQPRWIRPSAREIAMKSFSILILLASLFLLWKISKRLRRQIRLMVMSPRERALFELKELLSSDLIARQEFKEFYVRLTRIVRQFIERRHGIRAPEQTTEEFLAAISKDNRFPDPVAKRLKAFLHASDLVKFAAHTPDNTAIDDVTATARDYIESDRPEPADKAKRGRT